MSIRSTLGFTRALINLTPSAKVIKKIADHHPHCAVCGKPEGSTDDLTLFFLPHAPFLYIKLEMSFTLASQISSLPSNPGTAEPRPPAHAIGQR
ncbi:hypothetical protein AVEN_121554-1 [Araneus ventricosus]|uniref:Uncharacterized protein n=1 Tax=Araneus ventricosus TaxID=182803 RepID=A0A4Y2GPI0_ARAVE|nr:hypothetical protein AVEN_121554-1 [Araneus ventricosus]